jgi:hypothetical protein
MLRTSVSLLQQCSVLLDEAVRLMADVVAERTGSETRMDIYPRLVTSAAISCARAAAHRRRRRLTTTPT